MELNVQNENGAAQFRRLARKNVRIARMTWDVSVQQIAALNSATEELRLSVLAGDLILLDGKWYVTHSGLLRIARRNRCAGIRTVVDRGLSEPNSCRWIFKATVYKTSRSRGFVGYGDADPSNVSSLVRGAEMRVAETRAVNRALRKAYGIGLCSVEELGWTPRATEAAQISANCLRMATTATRTVSPAFVTASASSSASTTSMPAS